MASQAPPPPPSDRPLPSSFDDNEDFYNENGFQKVMRKIKQEPLVPLGCILTVVAFTNAWRASRAGDHKRVNRMFRYRVYAQGFTILAMVGGGIYYNADRHREREAWKAKREDDAEAKRQKWIRELEARDEEERIAKEKLEARRKRAEGLAAKRAAAAAGSEEGKVPASSGSGLGSWLWSGKKDSETPAVPDAKPAASLPTKTETKGDEKK